MVKIVVPTHGRAGRVTTTKLFPSCILCVTQAQEAAYRESNPDQEIVVHPDSVIGIGAKRQWMYDYFGDQFQVDDDATGMASIMVVEGESSKVDPKVALQLVERLAEMAEDLGVYLYGFAADTNPMVGREHKWFALTGWILAGGMGLRAGSKLYFRPDLALVDDYWLACLNAYHHRMMLQDRRYGIMFKNTFLSPGGLSGSRTLAACETQFHLLVTAFGSEIIRKKKSRVGRIAEKNGRDVRHEFQPMMRLPF